MDTTKLFACRASTTSSCSPDESASSSVLEKAYPSAGIEIKSACESSFPFAVIPALVCIERMLFFDTFAMQKLKSPAVGFSAFKRYVTLSPHAVRMAEKSISIGKKFTRSYLPFTTLSLILGRRFSTLPT